MTEGLFKTFYPKMSILGIFISKQSRQFASAKGGLQGEKILSPMELIENKDLHLAEIL
jgi:hypothetical protein